LVLRARATAQERASAARFAEELLGDSSARAELDQLALTGQVALAGAIARQAETRTGGPTTRAQALGLFSQPRHGAVPEAHRTAHGGRAWRVLGAAPYALAGLRFRPAWIPPGQRRKVGPLRPLQDPPEVVGQEVARDVLPQLGELERHVGDEPLGSDPVLEMHQAGIHMGLEPTNLEAYAELARVHDVPLNTIRTWLRRSLIRLRECLSR